ncbi:hypothetical protein CFP56_040676 [Quercus suber]|uniref:Secreted protein n=1 Tax=Quercus suber TaxID=58331 RepID=A0AAW0IXW4_QUESU|nr:hypothetical protein CFP56_70620 [Quercus suber]
MLLLPLSLLRQTTVIVRPSLESATIAPPTGQRFSPPTIYQPLLRLCQLHCLASPSCTASPITSQRLL